MILLSAERISFRYPRGPDVLSGVSLDASSGAVEFILGANGSGKSTLLHCLCGLLAPQMGLIRLQGSPIQNVRRRMRARAVGLVPQRSEALFGVTVKDTVLMGRTPHLGILESPGRQDHAVAREALEAVGLGHLAAKRLDEVSGGERQMILVARGLAQQARVLLMDEPDAHLDPRYQQEVLGTAARLARTGLSFVVTSHHPNNALLHATRIAFLGDGMCTKQVPPGSAVTPEGLEATYGIPFQVLHGPDGAIAAMPRPHNGPR
ncbi:ABC transporter ATP-binding protein [Candidatus Bipolaricaulota bacterium]|nr:ABC transporter ATP-binding protein [Candidatus Bipolaricaulota bacterium]